MRMLGIMNEEIRLDKDDFSNARYNCVALMKSPCNNRCPDAEPLWYPGTLMCNLWRQQSVLHQPAERH